MRKEVIGRRWELPARAIAATKRGVGMDDPSIDRVWHSYVGQARAAVGAFLCASVLGDAA